MGFRTVVVLSNDQAHEWEKDPELGKKIHHSASMKGIVEIDARFQYGEIIEEVHADTQTLAILDGYGGRPVAHWHWHHLQSPKDRDLALLKEFADKMGYRISKKPVKKD